MWTRREFLSRAGSGTFTGCGAFGAAGRRRPNVLVFMSDQESAVLPGPVQTPNRRRLEERGTVFTSAFCNTGQCSPARSTLLTGLEPHRTGVVTNVDNSSLGKPLPPDMKTIGNLFAGAGYRTGYFGKWHLGAAGPTRFGFEVEERGRDEAVAREAASWIAARREPWLAWVSVLNPHDIYSPPGGFAAQPVRPGVKAPATGLAALAGKPAHQQEYSTRYKEVQGFKEQDWLRYRSYYCSLVEKVDACLGAVLGAAGDLDSTLVVYTSDHGDALGEHGLPFKGPFMYEELIRIPLVIAGAAERLGGSRRDDMVTQADLVPTLAALAGVPVPRNLSGLDLAARRNARDAVLLEYCGQQHRVYPIRTVRTRRWKLNWYDDGGKELYDLNDDPHESRNRAGETACRQVREDLEKRLAAWRPPLTELERASPGRYLRRPS